MNYLSDTASKELLWAIRANFSIGLASWTETLDRFVALREMARPASPSHTFTERLLRLEEWPIESTWLEDDSDSNEGPNDENMTQSQIRRMPRTDSLGGGEDATTDWFYLVSSASGLRDWEFHQYDDDPYPSIPHGHKLGNHRWKLNAYQGWVYERSRQDHREPRWKIAALWNDRKFRTFALVAIEHHLESHPHHYDWRVANPLRLPRRR